MFYKTSPLDDENLKQRFYALAGKAGVSIRGIYTIEFSGKQTTANAVLVGIGSTRRVLLSDTLLADYSAEEIETVIAHELGHLKNRDGAGIFLFQALIILASLWITSIASGALAAPLGFNGIGDVAMLPLAILIFAVINLVFTPVSNAVMRSFEMAADDFAIRLTRECARFYFYDYKADTAEPRGSQSAYVGGVFAVRPSGILQTAFLRQKVYAQQY
jgi:STE24 endopeptidase